MTSYRVQREIIGWEEVTIEADTEAEALELVKHDQDSHQIDWEDDGEYTPTGYWNLIPLTTKEITK
jgi:hypothetical protein